MKRDDALNKEVGERFVSTHTPPEGRTRELLVILQEEAAEVIHITSKALRFGIDERSRKDPRMNRERMAEEIGDFLALVDELADRGLFSREQLYAAAERKKGRLAKYLQTEADE